MSADDLTECGGGGADFANRATQNTTGGRALSRAVRSTWGFALGRFVKSQRKEGKEEGGGEKETQHHGDATSAVCLFWELQAEIEVNHPFQITAGSMQEATAK